MADLEKHTTRIVPHIFLVFGSNNNTNHYNTVVTLYQLSQRTIPAGV